MKRACVNIPRCFFSPQFQLFGGKQQHCYDYYAQFAYSGRQIRKENTGSPSKSNSS